MELEKADVLRTSELFDKHMVSVNFWIIGTAVLGCVGLTLYIISILFFVMESKAKRQAELSESNATI